MAGVGRFGAPLVALDPTAKMTAQLQSADRHVRWWM